MKTLLLRTLQIAASVAAGYWIGIFLSWSGIAAALVRGLTTRYY